MAISFESPSKSSRLWRVVLVFLVVSIFFYSYSNWGDRIHLPSRNGATNAYFPTRFTSGVPDRPNEEYRKGLVVASMARDHVEWTDMLPDYDVYRYVNDDPTANLTVEENKGHEVMSYLTYLIDHFDTLPDIVVFVHAHEETYHNPWIFNKSSPLMLGALSPARVIREGFMNLHCGQFARDVKSCPALIRPKIGLPDPYYTKVWDSLYPLTPAPDALAQHCCGQFAVSRERVLEKGKEEIIRFRQWLLDTNMRLGIVGHLLEMHWAYFFTGEPVHCPDAYACLCDGYGYCFGGRDGWDDTNALFLTAQSLWARGKDIRNSLAPGERMSDEQKHQIEQMDEIRIGLERQAYEQVEAARIRGLDPEVRAKESNRHWEQGDGF